LGFKATRFLVHTLIVSFFVVTHLFFDMHQHPPHRLYVRDVSDDVVLELQVILQLLPDMLRAYLGRITVTLVQLPSPEAAEQWASAMQSTRVELEKKLQNERAAAAALSQTRQDEISEEEVRVKAREGKKITGLGFRFEEARGSAAAAQRESETAAEIVICQSREQAALRETERNTVELSDIMARIQAVRMQLWKLEEDECESALLEERLASELEQLQLKSQTGPENLQHSSLHSEILGVPLAAASSSDALSETSLSYLPHDLILRVNAVMDQARDAARMTMSSDFSISLQE
jgi:hypothetical protein